MSCLDHIPQKFRAGALNCAAAVQEMDYILLATHVNLDGDALGSLSACGYILKKLGKQFAIYSPTGLPQRLRFLPLPGKIHNDLSRLPFYPRCAIYLDCSEGKRLGEILSAKADLWKSINIDHHLADKGLGSEANFIDPQAAATAQLVAYFALALGLMPADGMAESIALGILTDTGFFANGNTTAEIFALCALLAQQGCELYELQDKLHSNWSLGRVHLWGELLSRVQLYDERKIAICAVSQEDFKHFHCSLEDLEGLVEWFRKIRGVEVAAILREESSDSCKFSLRSHGPVDVRSMAADLGGGGHFNAAGGNVRLSLEHGKKLLLRTIQQHLSR